MNEKPAVAGVILTALLAVIGGVWALYRLLSRKRDKVEGGQRIEQGEENIQIGQARDISISKGANIDVNAIVERLEERANREGMLSAQLQYATGQIKYLEDQNRQLIESVEVLAKGVKSDAPSEIDRALTLPPEGAAAARHIGAQAFLHDTSKALAAYREAVALDPDDPDGWNELGHLLDRTGDLDGAAEAYNRVLSLGNRTADRATIAVATGNLGTVYETLGDLNRAEEMHRKSLELNEAQGRKAGMAAAYGNLGNLYQIRGEFDRAEEMYRKSLYIDEALGRKEGMANQYGNLGILYQTRGDLDRAEEMYRKSLEIDEALGRKEGMASDYGNLGSLYQTRGELDRAEEMHRKSLDIEEALGRKEGMASDYGNLGALYATRGDLDRAEEMYRKSLELNEALGRKEGMADNYGNLGNLYKTRGDLDRAEEMYHKSLALFRELDAAPQIEKVEGLLVELRETE